MTLKSRVARLEERAGLSDYDDEFLGYVRDDEESNVVEGDRAVEDPGERQRKAAQTILDTMDGEDQTFVLAEISQRVQDKQSRSINRNPATNNLTRQFLLMVELLFRDEEPPIRSYGLPRNVAQIYRDYPLATAMDECRACGYFSPVLLWTGSPTDAGPKTAEALKLTLGHAFNCFQFFTRCPLCGGNTGGAAETHYRWQEVRRVFNETRRMRDQKGVETVTT